MQKNIVYGSITAGGYVHIGDKIYVIERDFPHSILFLRIEKGASGYEAMLSVKSEDDLTINLFRETLNVSISENLFGQVNEFQNLRRGTEGNRYRSAFDTRPPENWETVLTDEIYITFFSNDIGIVCRDFLDLLQSNKISELLLVISTEDERIQNLPWEMVLPKLTSDDRYDLPRNNFGLIRSREKTLQRFNRQGPTIEAAPLKLLFIPALPENMDERSKLLEIEEEQRKIIDAVRSLEATGDQQPKLVMEILDCANLDEIKEALTTRSHDIVHISGHGSYVEAVKEGILYLEDEDGNEQKTTGRELGAALRDFSSIKLLVLSACETAVGGSEGSTAEQMAAVGLPAVLAMRFSVTDIGARLFTEILYKKLVYGDTLTKAMHDARLALWEHVQERRKKAPTVFTPAEWFTPVLYQNQAIGALVKKGQYHTETLNRFYPKPAFIRGSHTRLIGEGFIGRKRLLIQLRQSFKQGKSVCLHGLGGLGKTTTAEAFAEHYRRRKGHDILIFRKDFEIQEAVILEKIYKRWKSRTNPDDALADELKTLLDSPKLEIEQKLQLLINNCLNGHRTILIFDNFEDVQTDKDGTLQQTIVSESLRFFLRNLLQKAPRTCHILFTTRYHIADFENLVTHLAIDKMSYAEQYRYLNFSETLRQLTTKEREIINRRMDGHPRALEFLEGLLKKDRTFDLTDLDGQIREVEGKISENLLLGRIFTRLNETERAVFKIASVFFGRTPLAALNTVMEKESIVLKSVLASLKDCSICFWDENLEIFEVHALTRAWMRSEKQPDLVQFKTLSQRAGVYFCKQQTLQTDFLAKSYFEQAEDWEAFTDISFELINLFRLNGIYSIAEDLNLMVLRLNISPKINAASLCSLGGISASIGDYDQAIVYYEKSLEIQRQIGDKNGECSTLNGIGGYYIGKGEYTKGLVSLEESLEIARSIDNKNGECAILNNIAHILDSQGNYDRALMLLNQSLEIARQIGDKRGEGTSLNNISQIYKAQKDYNLALLNLEKSLEITRQIGDKKGEGSVLNNLSQIYTTQGDYDQALVYLEQSLAITRQIGDKGGQGIILNNINQIYQVRGDYKQALVYLEQGLKIQSQIGDRNGEGTILYNMGVLYFGQFQDAEKAIILLYKSYQ